MHSKDLRSVSSRRWALLFSLTLFTACKHDFVMPTDPAALAGHSLIDAKAAALVTTKLNFSSGTPKNYSVSSLLVSTVAGGPSLVGVTQPPPVQGGPISLPGPLTNILKQPLGVASNGSGYLWVTDFGRNQVLLLQGDGRLVFPIGTGQGGSQDGSFTSASFNYPGGLAFGPNGKIYVADMGAQKIRVIDPIGFTVTTLAGSGVAGYLDGAAGTARFSQPTGIAVDANGVVYVADHVNNMIRKIATNGTVSLVAGQTRAGAANGAGTAATFNGPAGIAVGPAGELYVADYYNNLIRKIVSGNVSTLAGGNSQPVDGTGSAAGFRSPRGIATDAAGNVYVVENGDGSNVSTVRMITPAGVVTTLAGDVSRPGHTGLIGFADGYGDQTRLNSPAGITIDPVGNIFVADRFNQAIRKLTYVGGPVVKTFAGNGQAGYREGTDLNAVIEVPRLLATGPDGSMYFTTNLSRIRKITPAGVTSLVAGSGTSYGYKDGPAAQAQFGTNLNAVVGSDGTIYVSDRDNNLVRKIANGMVSTFVGNRQIASVGGDRDGTGTSASIISPGAIALDNNGDLLVAGEYSKAIRRITPAGVVKSVNNYGVVDGASATATELFVDKSGKQWLMLNLLVQDHVTKSVLYQFAGDHGFQLTYSTFSYPGDHFIPTNFAFGPSGKIYFADGNTRAIASQDLKTSSGLHYIVPGSSVSGFSDGPASVALFHRFDRIVVSPSGMIYLGDNNRIRMVPATEWQ